MSKKRNRRDSIATLLSPIATRRVPQFHRLPSVSYLTNRFALTLIEDRRTSYPGLKPYNRPVSQLTVGKAARLTLTDATKKYSAPAQTKATIAFQEPHKLPLCIRRKERREVLHATGKAGGKVKKPRRNEWSEVSCQS